MRIIHEFVKYVDDYESYYSSERDDWQGEDSTLDLLAHAEKTPVTHYAQTALHDEVKEVYIWFCGLRILTTRLLEAVKLNLPLRAMARIIHDDLKESSLCIERALRDWNKIDNGKKERRFIYQEIDKAFHAISTKRIPELELLNAAHLEEGQSKAAMAKEAAFEIQNGQVSYHDIDIKLPTGRACEIFEKLNKAHPKPVAYSELEPGLKNSASDSLRKEIAKINKSLKHAKMPFSINSKRTFGYVLEAKNRCTKKRR